MHRRQVLAGIGMIALSGCSRVGVESSVAVAGEATGLPKMQVHKNQGCACCDQWVKHVRSAGFAAEVHEVGNMGPIKERVGVPAGMGSCHTAEVDGYFVEGHVPVEDILRLLKERPAARGLTVPGMPLGSPGMEVPGQSQPFDVHLVATDGSTVVFAHHGA